MLYTVASWAVNQMAARFESHRFMLIVISGMMARLAVALALVILILVRFPVDARVFLVAFMATFVLGLLWEVRAIHRYAPPPSGADGAPPDHDASA